MNKIGIVCICIIMIFVLSACNSAANDEGEMPIAVPDPPTEEASTQPEQNDTPADESDDLADDPAEDNSDEPPFLKTLRTGVYGYDMYMLAIKDDSTAEGDSFVYSNGSLIAIGVVDDGELMDRYIYNCETHMLYWIFDEDKQYATKEDCDFWHKFGIPDFHAGFDQIGAGTTEFEEETFDYIDCVDCGSGEEVVRILIKDGDVYAFQHNANNWAHNLYLTKTFSSPPTTEYFDIPDDYVSLTR